MRACTRKVRSTLDDHLPSITQRAAPEQAMPLGKETKTIKTLLDFLFESNCKIAGA